MSPRQELETKIKQCRRFIETPIDDVTKERLRALLIELEERLSGLKGKAPALPGLSTRGFE